MTSEDTAASLQSKDPRYGLVVSITGQDRKMFRDGVQVAGDPDIAAIDEINSFLAEEKERSRTNPGDPLISARAIVSAHRTLDVLVRVGFPRLRPHARLMQEGAEDLRRLFLRELVRRLLTDEISEPKVEECLRELSGLIEAGGWPTWRADWDAWEDEICAKLAAKTAAPA